MTGTNRAVQLLLALALLGCLCSPALADGVCPSITVDENGNGTLNFTTGGGCASGGIFPMTGVLAPDPGPGGLPSVLTYNLLGPPSLVAGDVLMTDADCGGCFLDFIRFNPAGTGDPSYPASLLFYSDNISGADSLGDTPSPPGAFYPNVVSIPEVGPEGNNGAFYTPTAGQPGFVSGFNVSYHFISDTPEPGTLGLLGIGLLGLAASIRRRQSSQE
jgi:PEP-CTERM motif-containing protein